MMKYIFFNYNNKLNILNITKDKWDKSIIELFKENNNINKNINKNNIYILYKGKKINYMDKLYKYKNFIKNGDEFTIESRLFGGSNQIDFQFFIFLILISGFIQFISMYFLNKISNSNFFNVKKFNSNSTLNFAKNFNIGKKIDLHYRKNNLTYFIILSIFFITLINQHFFIEYAKIYEKCDQRYESYLSLGLSILKIISPLIILFIAKMFIGNKYIKNISNNSKIKYILYNPIIIFIITLLLLILWTIYTIYVHSNKQLPTSNPSYPYLNIILFSFIFSLIYFLYGKRKNIFIIMFINIIYISILSYNYVSNVGGINYNCNNLDD